MTEVIIPYKPRPYQLELHNNLKRFNVIVAHRRFGKTVFAVNQLIRDVLTCPLPNARGAYVAPLYSQAKRVAWDYMKEFTAPIPGVKYNISELSVDFPNGSRIYLIGADNPDSLRGIFLDSVVMDEVSQMNPKAWREVIRPSLADRKGKAIFIGTPSGRNAFYDFYQKAGELEDWYRALLTVEDTNALDEKELEAAKAEMGIHEYQQEFLCSWTASIKGAYYGNEMSDARLDGRITKVPWEPNLEVHTCWDLGFSDATAIWFCQTTAGEIRIIDHKEFTETSLIEIIKQLRELPYTYGQHFAPHDLEVRELSSGKSRRSIAEELGFYFQVLPKMAVADGIELGRLLIRRVWFDEENCREGLDCLDNYRRIWDDKRQVFLKQPLHDWSSHSADAWRYLGQAYEQLIRPARVGPPRQRRAIG